MSGKRHCRWKSGQVSAFHFGGEEITSMTNRLNIPFLDLVKPHQELETELLAVVKRPSIRRALSVAQWSTSLNVNLQSSAIRNTASV